MAFGAGSCAGWVAISELDNGVIERFRVTPASRFSLLMGTVLRDVVAFLVPAVIVTAVAIPFAFRLHVAGTFADPALLSLLSAATSAASNALGVALKQIGSLAAIVTGPNLPLTLLSGIPLPLSLAPAWMRDPALANPMYYAVWAARQLATGRIASEPVAAGFAVMQATAGLAIWWATRANRRAAG